MAHDHEVEVTTKQGVELTVSLKYYVEHSSEFEKLSTENKAKVDKYKAASKKAPETPKVEANKGD